MTEVHDSTFTCMGCEVRLLMDGPGAHARAADAQRWLRDFDTRLSRFEPASELCRLNADARAAVPASRLLRAAVRAGLWAAERTGGLVDPTLLDELEAAGYRTTRRDVEPASLRAALEHAPPRAPGRPHPDARWRAWAVDDEAGYVRRPPGSRFDTGGIGKGLAADAVAQLVADLPRFAVDCAGDARIGGREAGWRPFEVDVHHPLGGGVAHRLALGWGAVATSGLDARLWRTPDGGYAHHLMDPSTGIPAWTGLLSATALASGALEAETLAKAALLSGPPGARRILRAAGGVLVHDDGGVELVGPIHERRRLQLSQPVRIAA
jgi:thiamine biosynthesis lipoprotein